MTHALLAQTVNFLTSSASALPAAAAHFCAMKQLYNYKRTIGVLTVMAGVLSAACLLLGAHAVAYNFEAFSNPALALQYAHQYKEMYWFMLLDMAGYYLLLLPLIFYLHQQYKYQSPWVSLFSFSGIAYVLTGAIGAAILAATWPELMQQYLSATKAGQDTIVPLFTTITHMVTIGLWNILEVLFAATWWIGFGTLLYKDNKFIGVLSIIAGVACLLDSAGTMMGAKLLAETGVNVYLVLGIVWPLVLGIQLIRKSSTQSTPHSAVSNTVTLKTEPHVQG